MMPFPASSVTVAVPSEPRLTSIEGPDVASFLEREAYVPANLAWVVVVASIAPVANSNQAPRTKPTKGRSCLKNISLIIKYGRSFLQDRWVRDARNLNRAMGTPVATGGSAMLWHKLIQVRHAAPCDRSWRSANRPSRPCSYC